ncbi:hypothetical protein BJ742DRAFT_232335 [Cladochytrium replicatum]|nr:hypothetical protein BJ742DRAFT_232335 [Cladochytrium replicatum]
MDFIARLVSPTTEVTFNPKLPFISDPSKDPNASPEPEPADPSTDSLHHLRSTSSSPDRLPQYNRISLASMAPTMTSQSPDTSAASAQMESPPISPSLVSPVSPNRDMEPTPTAAKTAPAVDSELPPDLAAITVSGPIRVRNSVIVGRAESRKSRSDYGDDARSVLSRRTSTAEVSAPINKRSSAAEYNTHGGIHKRSSTAEFTSPPGAWTSPFTGAADAASHRRSRSSTITSPNYHPLISTHSRPNLRAQPSWEDLTAPTSPVSSASYSSSAQSAYSVGVVPKHIHSFETNPRRPITSVCVAEDRVYAATRDGAICEFDLSTCEHVRNLTGHSRAVSSLSAGGGRLFSASEDGTVRAWVVATGECSRVLTGHEGYVTAVCMTSEGRLFSAGADRLINEWDPSTGRRLWMLQGHTRIILALASGAGKLYSAGNDHTIRIWEMSTGKCVAVLEEHSDWVFSLAVYIPPANIPKNAQQGPTAPVLFSSSKDGSVKVWDVEGAKCVRTLVGHDRLPVRAVAVAEGGRLFTAGDDKAIVEWDVLRGKAVRTLAGHQAAVSSLVVTPNGLMYSGSGDTTISIWDIGSQLIDSGAGASNVNSQLYAPHVVGGVTKQRNGYPPHNNNNHHQYNSTGELERDLAIIREQLAKAQDQLSKQNRVRLRLKSELTAAHQELAAAREEVNALQGAATRVVEAEEELSAAKELLITYQDELESVQEAHVVAMSYILREIDRQHLEIEMDLAGTMALLEHPWTPLYKKESGIEEYMPRKPWSKCWETDDEWDSDVDLDEEERWWRHENGYDVKKRVADAGGPSGMEIARTVVTTASGEGYTVRRRGTFGQPGGEEDGEEEAGVKGKKSENGTTLTPYNAHFLETHAPASAAAAAARLFAANRSAVGSPAGSAPSSPMARSARQVTSGGSSPNGVNSERAGLGGAASWLRPLRNFMESTLEHCVRRRSGLRSRSGRRRPLQRPRYPR